MVCMNEGDTEMLGDEFQLTGKFGLAVSVASTLGARLCNAFIDFDEAGDKLGVALQFTAELEVVVSPFELETDGVALTEITGGVNVTLGVTIGLIVVGCCV